MAPFSSIDNDSLVLVSECGNDQTYPKKCLSPLHHNIFDNRSVGFSDCVEIHFVLHRNEYSEEEHQDSWYSKNEIKTIKNGVRESVAKLTSHPDMPDDDDYCARGLETRTREGARRKAQNKVDARAAVFFEQEMQREEEMYDAEEIADCYYEFSEPCHVAAHMIALRDEKEAKAIYAMPKTSSDLVHLGRIENGPATVPVASSAA